jgi:dolichol kinase
MSIISEIYRKLFHLLLLIIPMIYHYYGKWTLLAIFAPITAIFASFDYARRKKPQINAIFVKILKPILREHEITGEKFCGASWVGFATCINFALFKPAIAITAFIILAVSDTLAALVGKSIPSQPFFEKSIAGSSAFFISGAIILFCCGSAFGLHTWFYIFGLFALFCVTTIEARPTLFGVDDNFMIPITFSVIMTFFDIIWNYSY